MLLALAVRCGRRGVSVTAPTHISLSDDGPTQAPAGTHLAGRTSNADAASLGAPDRHRRKGIGQRSASRASSRSARLRAASVAVRPAWRRADRGPRGRHQRRRTPGLTRRSSAARSSSLPASRSRASSTCSKPMYGCANRSASCSAAVNSSSETEPALINCRTRRVGPWVTHQSSVSESAMDDPPTAMAQSLGPGQAGSPQWCQGPRVTARGAVARAAWGRPSELPGDGRWDRRVVAFTDCGSRRSHPS